ncbi:c-type cytochrome [Achromobacter sp. NPDC058515]|uniref:c-type cytochrome n=1 Tax=Achromobacter sp. NPDC058515 TaxID=3346533 RepID=UPI00364F5DA8
MAAPKSVLLAAVALGLAVGGHALAQPRYAIGTRATDAQIAGWNIDVAPDGKNLPPGSGTVARGKSVYEQACLACHGARLEGGLGPALAGGQGSLTSAKPFKTVGSYWPYATTLFDYIRRAMPFQAPQSLTNDEVYAVTGYVLHANQLLDAKATVNAATLKSVKMPNRDGFYVDDRPDAKNAACYRDCVKQP